MLSGPFCCYHVARISRIERSLEVMFSAAIAEMAELVEMLDAKSYFNNGVQVRFLFWIPGKIGEFSNLFSFLVSIFSLCFEGRSV